MNKNFDEWEETDFKEWASELYRAWLSGIEGPLEDAVEKREQSEVNNE